MPVENNNNNNNSDYNHHHHLMSEEQFWPTISADIATIHKLLDSDEPVAETDICSSCNMPFDKGKKRKLIDTCGHERCYTCVFRNEACPLCNSDNVKPPKKPISHNTSSNDIYGEILKKSTSVSSIGHSRPKVKTNGHFTSVMQARQSQDDYSWRDVSPSRLPRPNRTSEPSISSPINHDRCATPPQSRRKMFTTKGVKNYVWGLRGSSNSFNTISDDESGSNKPPKGKEESQRDLYTRLGLLLGERSPGVKTPSSNHTMNSSLSVSSLASLDIANFPSTNTSPVSTLTGSSETDAHRGTIKEASLDSVGSIMSMSSQSNCSLSPRSRRHSVTTTHPGPIEELGMFKNRRTSIRRSARAATIKGPIDPKVRFAQYRTNQLTLKPLFFEVPTQEADPLFTGRDWLMKELDELIKKETTSGISVNGLPGSGKTALILQLVDHSCFGRRRDTSYKQGVDTINGKDRPSSSEHSIYCQVNLVSSRVNDLASRVVAYHFCQADNYVTCAVPDFIHSIAAQLCQAPQLTAYKDYLLSEPYLQEFLSMKECIVDPDLAFTRGVLEPLCTLKRISSTLPGEDVLILVDGICEAEYHRPDHGDTIASFLAKHISSFPSWLKVIVTVRSHLEKVIPALPFNKISLDINSCHGDNIQKDLSDYINYRVYNSPCIQNNLVTGAAGQYRFSQHLQGLAKGSFLFAKLTLDLFEKGNLVAKSTSFKVLPVSLAQIFLLHFNLRFPTTAAFEKVSGILNVALAAMYPLTLSELYYSVNSLNVHTFISWEEFQQRIKILGGLLIKRMDNTYMLFHPTFREWLIKRDDNESSKFLCDIRTGHAGIAFRLSRLEAPLDAEKTLELGHHLLKAHIYKNMTLVKYSSTDMQSYWICSVSENVSDALCFLRNVYSPNAKVSRLLLLSGASANHRSDFLGQAPVLCLFAHEGMSDMVALLLEFGADVYLTNSQGCTALILAAMRGHADVVCQLVAAGAALGKTDTAGRCAIVHAARNGHLNIVAYLLSCDWVIVDPKSEIDLKQAAQQALVAASSQGYIEILEYLLDMSEVDINGEDSLTGETALTTAATNGCADVCVVLIERGCEISVTNRQELSALMLAARDGHWTTVDRLLQYQLSIEQTDKQGRTPLMIASSEGHVDIILLLLDKGAKIDAEDYENMTSLCWACSRGRTQAAEYLLDRGADINHSNKLGATPINLAAFQGNPVLVQLLLDRGAMIEHADLEGIRPLDRAISCRNIPVVQCFLRKGAKLGPTTWNMANGKHDVMLVLLNKLLEDGNVLLRKCRLNEASHRYSYALNKFPPIQQMDSTFRQLRLNFLLNYSRCKRKMKDPLEAVNLASEVLKFKPESYEALYARAKAYIDLRKNDEALSDIQEALLLLPPQKRDIRNVLLKLQYDIRDGSLSSSVTTLNSPTETSL